MKYITLAVFIFLLPASSVRAGHPGSTRGDLLGFNLDQVYEMLGESYASELNGDQRTLYYEEGKIVLEQNTVIKADLLHPRILKDRKQHKDKSNSAAKDLYIKQGLALRKFRLADPCFINAPATDQLAWWDTFRRTYPDIPPGRAYQRAIAYAVKEHTRQRTLDEQSRRIQTLEHRLETSENKTHPDPAPFPTIVNNINVFPPEPAPVVAQDYSGLVHHRSHFVITRRHKRSKKAMATEDDGPTVKMLPFHRRHHATSIGFLGHRF